jgi:deoxyadenosine/deoxycytidine kinase
MSSQSLTILVEGNIGVGKTTLINIFSQEKDVEIALEPVDKWQNLNGINLFQRYYKEPNKFFATFQSYVFLTQWQQLKNLKTEKPIIFIERSPFSAKNCFMAAGEEILTKEDYYVLDAWFQEISKEISNKIDLIIYMQSKPKTCFERMQKRKRPEEDEVDFELIKKLHILHDKWLIKKLEPCPAPVLIFDADQDLNYFRNEAKKVLNLLRSLNSKPNPSNEINYLAQTY